MDLEKGYRPAGDLIIEDADYQPAGISSLCIEVCPTFYRDWTIRIGDAVRPASSSRMI